MSLRLLACLLACNLILLAVIFAMHLCLLHLCTFTPLHLGTLAPWQLGNLVVMVGGGDFKYKVEKFLELNFQRFLYLCHMFNLQHVLFGTDAILNRCNLQQGQFSTSVICNTFCNTCNLQQVQFAISVICNQCNLQHVQFATPAICNTCNLQHMQFETL